MENLCYYISNEEAMDSLHVSCPRPMIGRYIKLTRESGGYQDWSMNFCEVQVFGYLHKGTSSLMIWLLEISVNDMEIHPALILVI